MRPAKAGVAASPPTLAQVSQSLFHFYSSTTDTAPGNGKQHENLGAEANRPAFKTCTVALG